jgi:hypothetical protein
MRLMSTTYQKPAYQINVSDDELRAIAAALFVASPADLQATGNRIDFPLTSKPAPIKMFDDIVAMLKGVS